MLILVKFFKKTLIFPDISENLDFVKLSKNVGLEILILVKIVEKSQIWSKLSKTLDFEQIVENSPIGSKFTKTSILIIIDENVEFNQNFQKDFEFGKNFRKCWFW